jgi:hypothetical protein
VRQIPEVAAALTSCEVESDNSTDSFLAAAAYDTELPGLIFIPNKLFCRPTGRRQATPLSFSQLGLPKCLGDVIILRAHSVKALAH